MLCRLCQEENAADSIEDAKDGIMFLDDFKTQMKLFEEARPDVYKMALLEISQTCESVDDVPRERRNEIIGIMGCRINISDKYITQAVRPNYGMGYKVPGETYGFVKEGYGCFREE